MKLFLINIRDVTDAHWEQITPERRDKALRYRFSADRKRCVAGGLLLRRFLGDTPVYTDAFGKPRAENGVCFNLSHSGDWVIMALSDKEVGCDIERHRQTDALRMGRVVFTENELASIRQSRDRLGRFYVLWTKKEALLKCMGKGFHRAAKTVDVSGDVFCEDGVTYRMKTKVFADYTVSVCTQGGDEEWTMEYVHL